MKLSQKGEKCCAYPDCRRPVTDDDHCAGCDYYVCETHSTNPNADGFGHDVVEHWTDDDE